MADLSYGVSTRPYQLPAEIADIASRTGNSLTTLLDGSGILPIAALTRGGSRRNALEALSQTPIPIASDAASVALVPGDLAQGDWVSAGLNALGVLPFVPAMAMFRPGGMAYRPASTGKMADQLAEAARLMGLDVSTDASRISASRYLRIGQDDAAVRVRISDHPPKASHPAADFYFSDRGPVADAVKQIADQFGVPVPARWTDDAVSSRSASATAAASTRSASRRATEDEMGAQLTALLRERAVAGTGTARRIARELFPDAPGAAIGRIANSAAGAVGYERHLARVAAINDPATLADMLAKRQGGAPAFNRLVELVGEEQAMGMRPTGFPRPTWRGDR